MVALWSFHGACSSLFVQKRLMLTINLFYEIKGGSKSKYAWTFHFLIVFLSTLNTPFENFGCIPYFFLDITKMP